jgi:hypothetical protein
MQDEFIGRVSALVEELRSDIAGIERVMQEAEAARSKYREKLHLYEEALATYRQVMGLPTTPQDQLPLVGTLRGTIADMCAQVIELRKEPVSVGELVKILTAAGKFRDSKNYRGNYGTVFGTLQRDERFGKVRGKGVFYLLDRTAESPLFGSPGEPRRA